MDSHAVRRMLHARCVQIGSQKAYAASLGVSDAYLSEVLRGAKAPGPKILAALGVKRLPPQYERVDGDAA